MSFLLYQIEIVTLMIKHDRKISCVVLYWS